MSDIAKQIADIDRRLLGLKALRPVEISQVQVFYEEWTYPLVLAPFGDPGDSAGFQIDILCAGNPIADIGMDGFAVGATPVLPRLPEWDIVGNTAIAYLDILNDLATPTPITFIIKAWALNGLSATCERIS